MRTKHWLLSGILLVFALAFARTWVSADTMRPRFGVTFSPLYAQSLGLDAREVFSAMLTDLSVRNIRLPVYWSTVEKENGRLDWTEYDWMVAEAGRAGAHVTLVIGGKVPRWPECNAPDWTKDLSTSDREDQQLSFVEEAVRRYKGSKAVVRWQVENEPLFPFGTCPKPDPAFVRKEIAAVRAEDSRPIQVTVSGELEPWLPAVLPGDVVGMSLYRSTWSQTYGYAPYLLPPAFYRLRAVVDRLLGADAVIISELQAEPWFSTDVNAKPDETWYQTFTAEDLGRNVSYARATGSDEIFLWGIEWWYRLKKEGDSRLWDAARAVLQ